MSYTVLARRYRSRAFDELVGQEVIAQTLLKAIELKRVAHAYLFTGMRGVGKTSTARLFARALNAVDDKGKENPEVAEAIMQGRDTDVIEIDAASNTGVDNVRELIASAVYRPMRGRWKVYIIDEVHMLSTGAFNALLKTMEEPPEHVVFILCTTETHKVPATIQSRCQRFDFHPISTTRIAEHLASVCKQEKVSAEPDLLHLVARLGNGSMRDALSLLDRLMAAGEKKLTTGLLERMLGLPDRTLLAGLLDAVAAGDPGAALARANDLIAKGVSTERLLTSIAERLHELMLLATCGADTPLVELPEGAREEAAAQAAKFDPAALVHMIALCESVAQRAKMSSFPRALIDSAIVRMAMADRFADAAAVAAGAAGAVVRGTGAATGAGAKKR